MNRCVAGVLMGWAMLTGFAKVSAQQAPPGPARAIIVFDASGSMYGQVPGGVKIDIAKKAVTDIVSAIDPAMELGLIAYGHRSKGDCADIELLVPPQANSASAVLKAVKALQPKGKTPLTDAVMQAAQFLKFQEARASVILVSDGVETCERDPCMAAEELERLGIDFTCHVIGFDIKQGESIGLECLANKTGGMYLAAKDATTLKSSLEAAMKQVAKPATTLVVEPKASSGGPVIDGVTFELFAAGGGEKAVATGTGGRWSVELPKSGKYTVSAKLNGKSQEVEAEVKEGATVTREVVFAATGLRAAAYDKEGGRAYESGVAWDLYGPADGEGNRGKVAFSYDAKPMMKVAAGTYLLRASRGNASASVEVTVKEGVPEEVKVILGSGDLKLSAITADGQQPLAKDVAWDIFGLPDAEGTRRKLAFSYDAQPRLTLPSGPCLVTAAYGDARGQIEAEVKAGEVTEVVVKLGSGKLKLSVLMEEGGQPVSKDVAWDVFGEADAEGNRKKATFSYDAQPVFSLAAGKYQVKVGVGEAGGTTEVEVKAGETVERVIVLGAGRVKLSAMSVEGADPISKDLAWDVLGEADAEGNRKKVSFSYDAQPIMSLPAGKYVAKVAWGQAEMQRDIEVAAGKLTEFQIVLNAGTVDLSAIMGEGADPVANDIAWDVFKVDAEGEKKKMAFSYDPQPKFRLPAGEFLVEVGRGSAAGKGEIKVAAGKLTSQVINLNAGTLKLSSSTGGVWEIMGMLDAEGNRKHITTAYDAQAKVFLPTGRFLVVRKEGEKKAEKEIEIKPNTLSELTLDAK